VNYFDKYTVLREVPTQDFINTSQ